MTDQAASTGMIGAKPSTPAHPLARVVMRLLTYRSDADLRFVFAAVAERVRPECDGRRESALASLERCAIELEVTGPTARTYATWRQTSDGQRGAPSVQQIRTISGPVAAAISARGCMLSAPEVSSIRLGFRNRRAGLPDDLDERGHHDEHAASREPSRVLVGDCVGERPRSLCLLRANDAFWGPSLIAIVWKVGTLRCGGSSGAIPCPNRLVRAV